MLAHSCVAREIETRRKLVKNKNKIMFYSSSSSSSPESSSGFFIFFIDALHRRRSLAPTNDSEGRNNFVHGLANHCSDVVEAVAHIRTVALFQSPGAVVNSLYFVGSAIMLQRIALPLIIRNRTDQLLITKSEQFLQTR